jgi:predicted anti-sigma-YlaC factor YlaD
VSLRERLWIGSCHETEGLLSEHLEGDLRGLRRRRVLTHLGRCEMCRAVLASLGRTIDALRSLRQADERAAESVADAVVERIRLELSGESA